MTKKSKIFTIPDLTGLATGLKLSGKRIVQCHGVFDLLHPGHLKHLEFARELGEILIVTITADKHVNKGPNKPVYNETLRAESPCILKMGKVSDSSI